MESRKDFKWTVYAVSAASLLLVLVTVYLSIRFIDGLWSNVTLPILMILGYSTVCIISAMFLSLSERKCESCPGCYPNLPCGAQPAPVIEEPAPVVKTRKPRTPKAVPVVQE